MAGFASIRTKIKAKLITIASLAFVADTFEDNLDGFPAAIFDVSDSENDFLTNADNSRIYTFTILVFVPFDQDATLGGPKTNKEATDILDAVADDIVDAFESDIDLGGEVDWCLPFTGSRDEVDSPQGHMLMQELIISCVTSKQVEMLDPHSPPSR